MNKFAKTSSNFKNNLNLGAIGVAVLIKINSTMWRCYAYKNQTKYMMGYLMIVIEKT